MDIQSIFDKYIGKPVEAEDPSNVFQCFDWAFKYCDELGIDRAAIRHLYAYEIWTKPNDKTLASFDYIPNTPNGVPQLGDILVFGTGVGVAGHVSVVQKADVHSIRSTDQNWNGHKYVEYITHPYDNVLGWLRPIQNIPDQQSTIDELEKEKASYITQLTDAKKAYDDLKKISDDVALRLQNRINDLQVKITAMQKQIDDFATMHPDSPVIQPSTPPVIVPISSESTNTASTQPIQVPWYTRIISFILGAFK